MSSSESGDDDVQYDIYGNVVKRPSQSVNEPDPEDRVESKLKSVPELALVKEETEEVPQKNGTP